MGRRFHRPLPAAGRLSEVRLWSPALDSRASGLPEGATDMAQGADRFCRFAAERAAASSPRHCVRGRHDGLLNFPNSRYWDAMETASRALYTRELKEP